MHNPHPDQLLLRAYTQLRLADLRTDTDDELWAIFVDRSEPLPGDTVLPLEEFDEPAPLPRGRGDVVVSYAVCDRAGDRMVGHWLVHALTAGTLVPDAEITDAATAALWLADRYRAALGVGAELELAEAVESWQQQVDAGQPVIVSVADRVLVIVPEDTQPRPLLAAAGAHRP